MNANLEVEDIQTKENGMALKINSSGKLDLFVDKIEIKNHVNGRLIFQWHLEFFQQITIVYLWLIQLILYEVCYSRRARCNC